GQVPLDRRDQPGVVRLGLEEPGRPARPSSTADARDEGAPDDARRPPRSSYPSVHPEPADDADLVHTAVDDSAIARAAPISPGVPVLPFQRPPQPAGEARSVPAGASGL